MFTGIIEELGTIESVEARGSGARFRIRCRTVLEDSTTGSSINVNGVCLTAVELRPGSFDADLSPESLTRSTLAAMRAGERVNLERPMSPSGRLGGHIVQGHVDAVGELVSVEPLGDDNWWLQVRVPQDVLRYLVFKGSIAIDGVSLTIAAVEGDVISVTVIPHTYCTTTLQFRRPGDRVNLECDILAKYVERMMGTLERPSGLTVERLKELGY